MAPFPKQSSFLKGAGHTHTDLIEQRMLERHKKIIEANVDYIKGKTVLDLASHNGRWTYAALGAGATFAFGIEGRQELIDRGLPDFADIDPKRYAFAQGDIYDMCEISKRVTGRTEFDTIFCLGIYYHITDHYRLLRLMRTFKPSCIIIDSGFMKTETPMVQFRLENSNDPSMAIREVAEETMSLSGISSWGFIRMAANLNGYDITRIPWKASNVTYREAIDDYIEDPKRQARRYTIRLTPKASA